MFQSVADEVGQDLSEAVLVSVHCNWHRRTVPFKVDGLGTAELEQLFDALAEAFKVYRRFLKSNFS
jgi:hypothetical protein